MASPGGGVASVPVGILAQIHEQTSRRTAYNQSSDRRFGLVEFVSLSPEFC